MATDSKTYTGVTRSVMDKLRAGLEKAKIALPAGDSGQISSAGLTGTFHFDDRGQTLQLEIQKYPMFMPKGMIWKAIDGQIAAAQLL
ncbi:MAG: hypothetical protein NVSMB31_15700 [Vulcanimicrobiaceae bacterium]